MRRELALLLSVACCFGCTTPGAKPPALASQPAPATPANAAAADPASEGSGFSLTRMLEFAGFQRTEKPQPSLIPQEVVDLSNVINTVSAKSAELNMNDPPEVTRQKAQAILEALAPWDSTLAAGHSAGFLNTETAQMLNNWASQLRVEAQKLVHYVPTPETIGAIQHLAGSLNATVGNISKMLGQGQTISQAFLGGNRG